ncbi:MAG: DtxR family transcriptional regulator [Candidatus Hydrogenedentota bacterium]|nr:MAG: DtxR family transcriptional regulator [Candidatus Hydrogenedentota bacterium]
MNQKSATVVETNERTLDHFLVRLYSLAEDRNHHVGARIFNEEEVSEEIIAKARSLRLVEGSDRTLRLTDTGESLARDLVRRYRLAERLFSDLLGLGENDDQLTEAACRMEHVLSPSATDAICTLLGHPPVCPHGRPIAPGPCCREAWSRAPAVVVPLHECAPGTQGQIAFVGGHKAAGLEKLADLGLVPGTTIRLVRHKPIPILEIGEARLAVEAALASQIYIRPAETSGSRGAEK